MAITRAQQAKQMLRKGGRIGFKGGADMGTVDSDTRKATVKSVSISPSGDVRTSRTSGPPSQSSADRDTGLEKIRQRNINKLKTFQDTKPDVKTPPLSVLSFFKKPLQKFSNFTTARNRAFFEDVIRAGKIPGLNFATLDDLTPEELEEKYQDYMSERLAGNIDAYGNPLMRGDDGPDPIPFIPKPIEELEEEIAEYVNPLSLLTPRIAGTQFAADGGRIGFRIGSESGKDTSGRDYASDTAASRSVRTSPSRDTDGGGDDRGGPKGPPKIINPPPKEKKSFRDFLKTTKEKTQPFRDFLFLRDLATGNIPGALTGIATQLLPISQKGIANPNLATGNIVYDERLGLIDATTGEPIDTTMPDAQQIKTFNTKEDLVGMGAAKDSFFDTLTPEGKALEKFRKSAVGFKKAEANPANDPQSALNFMLDRPGLYGDVIENKDFIQGAIDKGFLETEQDYTDQLPLGKAVDLAGGGIASLDREEFLLGGIAKGLKKAVRGVKKIAKSKIGKAALLGALGYGLGGGTFFGKMLPGVTRGGQGFGGFGGLSSIFGNVGDIIGGTGLGDKFAKFAGNKIGMGILGASVLPLIFGKKQDDDEFDLSSYYAQNQLEPSQSIRGMGSEFDFYGGPRMRVADGGDVEPVAKKTMPLLDMDGKEKDYRETGGFVDMGRMERADDVPARLSKNEFVFTADAVRNAGEGDIDKGAEVMYNMMKNLEAGGEVSEESQGLEGARKCFKHHKD